ncbi:hypothetical protein PGT21_024490 [Puccinia graminis f. sp. tritici]|uniref:Uncharacterized protein n=1 Tax=Puccinia graminis f. sp. tritici TaxID=56615 RepID=A0A5B0PYF9_PUCGR|nr:hypothetical protein PGT21_024490 [Puccinia graminis f. sp. tritici]
MCMFSHPVYIPNLTQLPRRAHLYTGAQVRPQFSSNSAGKSTISTPAVTQGQTAVEPLTNLTAWFIPAKNWANPLLKPGKFRANKPWPAKKPWPANKPWPAKKPWPANKPRPANKPQPANNPRGFESTTGLIVRHRISSDCFGIRAFRTNRSWWTDMIIQINDVLGRFLGAIRLGYNNSCVD